MSLFDSEVYRKYAQTAWSSITVASVEADLDAINQTSIENIELIEFLTRIHNSKLLEALYDDHDSWFNTYYKGFDYYWGMFENATPTSTHIHDKGYVQDLVAITLSSGSAANQELRAASATKKLSLAWCVLHFDTAPGAAYFIDFHEADGSAILDTSFDPSNCGKKYYCSIDTATNNKALQGSFTGGGGSENLFLVINTCAF